MPFNDIAAVFCGRYDNVNITSALTRPTAIILGNGTAATDTDGFLTGPRPFFIHDVQATFRDLTFTDPNEDWHLGLKISYSVDGGANYTTALALTANADCGLVWDDSVGAGGEDFVLDTPQSLFAFVGLGGNVKQSTAPTASRQTPVRIPAHAYVRIEVGLYVAGTLTTANAQDLDNLEITVFGKAV